VWLGAILLLSATGCGEGAPMTITITSAAFKAGGVVPSKHTGEGEDVSPALQWTGVPQNAKQLALICDDPDAPVAEPWVHWVIYGLPANCAGLPEAMPKDETLKEPAGAVQGKNDFGKIGYGGPMPPRGHGTHHYHFKLYALDTALNLPPGQTKKQLLAAMKGHILAQGELIGTYSRK
jgi:hypothetical protein